MFTIVSFGQSYKCADYMEYICDTAADLDSLPTSRANISIGSKALVIATKKIYILDNNREWAELCDLDSASCDLSAYRTAADQDAIDAGMHEIIASKADKTEIVYVPDNGDVTIALGAGKVYYFTGVLTSLNIGLAAPDLEQLKQYHLIFSEGSTAFEPVFPNTVKFPRGFTWSADTQYEVDILDDRAAVTGWVTSGVK